MVCLAVWFSRSRSILARAASYHSACTVIGSWHDVMLIERGQRGVVPIETGQMELFKLAQLILVAIYVGIPCAICAEPLL